MTDGNDPGYYQRRETRERELAARAISPAIARIHIDLADRYAERLQGLGRPEVRLTL